MNLNFKIYQQVLFVFIALVFFAGCGDDPAYSSDYDIKWPVPVIASISPASSAEVSSNLTITGNGLDKVMSISIDNRSMTIVSKTETTLTATLPRKFNASTITMTNLYRQTVVSTTSIAPEYPDVVVSEYPIEILKGDPIIITGTNLDLVTSVIVGSNVVAVSSTNATTLSIPTVGLNLDSSNKITLIVKSNYSSVVNDTSAELDVVE